MDSTVLPNRVSSCEQWLANIIQITFALEYRSEMAAPDQRCCWKCFYYTYYKTSQKTSGNTFNYN